jgi:hypothetical protein
MGKGWQPEAVFVCEDVSSIEFKDGLFYLTDDFGDFQIRRAMRPSTFLRCVAGAAEVAREFDTWRRKGATVLHAAKPDKP